MPARPGPQGRRARRHRDVDAALAVRERARLITTRKIVLLPPSPLPDKLYAVTDGTGVPMTSKETTGREGKGEDGRARTREVKLAVFFTQDEAGEDGYPVRDRDSASVITTFGPAAEFGKLVRAEGIRRGAGHVRQFTVIGDGAPWIWGIASEKFPEATQIVDLFHAREHIHSLTRSVEFMLGDRRQEWLAKRLDDLDYGDIDGIERAVREFPFIGVKKDEVDRELGYFLNNAPRMRYHWFRSRGLFVGSGVVEASCKTVIGLRLKQSGMHWHRTAAEGAPGPARGLLPARAPWRHASRIATARCWHRLPSTRWPAADPAASPVPARLEGDAPPAAEGGTGPRGAGPSPHDPLHVASGQGPLELVHALLDAGARIDVADFQGKTIATEIRLHKRRELYFLKEAIQRDYPRLIEGDYMWTYRGDDE